VSESEIAGILSLIKVAYPRFYSNITEGDVRSTISLWREMFKDENAQEVLIVVKELINELEFPPTIADIKNKLKKKKEYMELLEYAKKCEELEKQQQLRLRGEK
jgi:SOS-response transcriptional repressor LexA